MTAQQLRDLLEERVADLTAPDLTVGAWSAGRRTRRRTRLAAVGAAAVVTAAAGAGLAVLGDGSTTGPEPAPALPKPPPAGAIERQPDATYQGVPVYFSPDETEEQGLPRVTSEVLPAEIDLGANMVESMDHAVAALSVGDTVYLVDEDGGQVAVDIGRLDDVTKPNGYAYRPVHDDMLSPDGKHLIFPQDGGYLEVYSLDGGWNTIYVGTRTTRFVQWAGDDLIYLPETAHGVGVVYDLDGNEAELGGGLLIEADVTRPDFAVRDIQPYGPTRFTSGGSTAQTWGMGLSVPVSDSGTYLSDPEFIATRVGGIGRVLSLQWTIPRDGEGGRYKQCCPVAGWLDDRTLVYESRQTSPVLVSWDVGTHHFELVTTIKNYYDIASFARLG
jgi:hypothetical protein